MQTIMDQLFAFFNINWNDVLNYFMSLIITAGIAYITIFIFRFLLHNFFKRTHFVDEKQEATIESVVKNTSHYLFFIIVIIAGIRPFFENLQDLLLAGGIIAAVIGFGAQKVINDLLSGMFMIFEGTIQKGDFVNINGEPEGGTVEELGFRVIKIRLLNGKLVTVPNGEIRRMVNGNVEVRRIYESIIVSFQENPSRIIELLHNICSSLNESQKEYLKKDEKTGEYVEIYRVYGLHSLDTSPYGYKFTITATVHDHDYLKASQEAKLMLAQMVYDQSIQLSVAHISNYGNQERIKSSEN